MINYFIIAALALLFVLFFAFTAWRWGAPAAVPVAVLVLLSFFLNKTLDEALFIAIAALLGFFSGYVIRKNLSLTVYLVAATLFMGTVFTGQYYMLKKFHNIDSMQQSRIIMEKWIKDAPLTEEQRSVQIEKFKLGHEFIQNKMPFLFFMEALIFSALAFFAVKIFLVRFHKAKMEKGLELFRLSDYFIFALIAGLGTVLLVDGQEYPLIYLIALNMGLITALLYLVQAMGVIKFFLMKRNMPRYLLPVMFLFLLLTGLQILPFFLIILAGFGTLDLWADFRKLNTVEKPEI